MDFTAFILTVLVILIGILWLQQRKKSGKMPVPPGPPPLPIVGNLLQMGRWPHRKFTEWSKKYGPVIRVWLGNEEVVVITDAKLIREGFGEIASHGRPSQNPVFQEFFQGVDNGIINTDGPVWDQQRKFAIKTLRSFGISSVSIEGVILDEIHPLLNYLRKQAGTPLEGTGFFLPPMIGILWRIITGERLYWEEKIPEVIAVQQKFIGCVNTVVTNGLMFFPMLRFVAPNYFGWPSLQSASRAMFDIVNTTISKHKNTFDPFDLRDFIDHYIAEIENTKDRQSTFYQNTGGDNLRTTIFDLFTAGTDSTGGAITWGLLLLSHNQDVQKKLQKEIDEVLGSRMPGLADRNVMPYTEAVVFETLRAGSVIGLGVPHKALDDFVIGGYKINKGTTMFANNYGVHYDEKIWGDPHNFRPERFLVNGKAVPSYDVLAFAEGKRKCIGEKLAQSILFLKIACMFQQFNIRLEKKADLEHLPGLVLHPRPFKFVVQPRF